MTDTTTTTTGRNALRVVLFGMPDAGKSSLLGALAQAAQTQEHLLHGHLADLSQGLGELQRRLYDERPRETLEEVVPYPVTFTPFTGPHARRTTEAVLIDCDGRVANELLSRRRTLDETGSDKTLAHQIGAAEALVLVVDASANPSQVDADFTEFGKFLRLLQQHRGQRSEVGGLPVFLVLSKCDLLAQADDTPAAWIERIEEQQQHLRQRFQHLLADSAGPLPFGSIDLHLWATAVKRPDLAGVPARPREPYGVAELFRQALAEAAVYRDRQRRAGRRLALTVTGTAAVVAAMVGLAVALAATHPATRTTPLEPKIEQYRSSEGPTASSRLREPLQQKISVLREFQHEPDFAHLPPELQRFVNQRLQELQDYQAYKEKLEQSRPPELARNDKELDDLRNQLQDELALPAQYQGDWGQTEAALLRDTRLADARALRGAVNQVEQYYRDLKQRGDELWNVADLKAAAGPLPWNVWFLRVTGLLKDAAAGLFAPTDRVPDARQVTYASVLRFARVADARADWEQRKTELESLRDLAAALGLPGNASPTPPALQIPADGFSLEQARVRLRELEKYYPDFRNWPRLPWPDAALPTLRQTAATSYRHTLPPAQDALLRQLQQLSPDGRETPERWRELRDWLGAAPELAAWRELAAVLAGLAAPKAEDPVAELQNFLRQERFDLDLRSLTLTMPDNVKARPVGALTVFHRTGSEPPAAIQLTLTGTPMHDPVRGLTRYPYTADGRATLSYKPGDGLWAELGLTRDAEGRERSLLWSGGRSMVFQFERLTRAPRLLRKGQKDTDAPIAEGVFLAAGSEGSLPRVPDLLPVVILRKKN